MNGKTDITSLIERLDFFEDRLEVTLDALFAEFTQYEGDDDGTLRVNGELRPRDGSRLKQNVTIIVDVNDLKGRLISRLESPTYWMSSFIGFATFSILDNHISCEIAKLRIYPKPD